MNKQFNQGNSKAIYYKFIVIVILFNVCSFAQLKEFVVTPLPSPSEFPPIMRSHPEDAAIIIYTTLTGLQFESNNNQINDIKEEDGKFTIFIKPEKTIVKFKKKDFIEQNLPTLSLAAKEVKYFKIESKQDINASVISINILTDPSGAKIYIDGSLKGTEPTHKVVPGVHNIKIEMDGYTTLQKAIEVTEENNLFRFPLEKVEQVGIQIRSIPDKAQIYPPDTGDIWYCLGAVWHSRRRNMG